jgi:putative Mn2+ efflux pump MntP
MHSLQVTSNPYLLIAIGFILVMFGFLAPLMMTIQVIQSTFFLNFASYTASFLGLVLGVIGSAMIYQTNRNRDRDE